MEPGQIDHVAEGIAAQPEKLRKNRISRYLAVYLAQFDSLEGATLALINAFLNWQTLGNQRNFVLDTIGSWLAQPRPDNYSNEQYVFVLQARVLVRQSSGVENDVYRVALFLALGNQVRVFRLTPKIIHVVFVNLVLSPDDKALYYQLLLDTVDAVDSLEVFYVTNASALYDFSDYDEGLYA